MKVRLLLSILILNFLVASCWTSKKAKRLYRKNQVIKESEPIIQVFYQSAVATFILTIRENYLFDVKENVMWFPDYHAGTWEQKGDTFHLRYINGMELENFENFAVLNSDSTGLILTMSDPRTEREYPVTYLKPKK